MELSKDELEFFDKTPKIKLIIGVNNKKEFVSADTMYDAMIYIKKKYGGGFFIMTKKCENCGSLDIEDGEILCEDCDNSICSCNETPCCEHDCPCKRCHK